MLEENYLSYPEAIKEAMGIKVDWSEKINEESESDESESDEGNE